MSIENQSSIEEMKINLCSLFHRRLMKMSDANSVKRKLVLHFDLNKTIVPVDSATGETVEAALNVYLSGMAWGKEYGGAWQSSEGQLSRSPSAGDVVSFYKFEEKRLLPQISQDRATLRYHLTSFTDKPEGSNYKPYLNTLLQKLRWTIPYDESLHNKVTVPGTKSHRFHFILPSFYKLLNYLVSNGRDFAVIFRTFGSDARSVLQSIITALSRQLPFCENLNSLKNHISDDVYILKREIENGRYCFMSEYEHLYTTSQFGCSKTDDEMYTILSNMMGIHAIQDNVTDWSSHCFHPTRGKPVWIDHSDHNVHHIFFDDNIRPGSHDSIVNIRVRESLSEFRNIESAEEYKFVNTHIVPVTFSDAIQDDDYFVQKLITCESNFSKFLDMR